MALTTRIINLRRVDKAEEAKRDLQTAKALLRNNPHLQHLAQRIDELEDEQHAD